MPTVEQLYTIIGAKDGFIYDLQMQLSGFAQERQNYETRIEELEKQVAQWEGNNKPGQMSDYGDSPSPIRLRDVVAENAKESGVEVPEVTFENTATFRPR